MQYDQREQLIQYVQKKWGGSNALRLASEAGTLTSLPTGFAELDDLLGGGLPAGRITTLHAGTSSGATAIAYTVVAALQAREYIPAHLDADRSFDPASAANTGVDVSRLILIRPEDPIETLAISSILARSGGFDLILLDRLSAEYRPEMLSTWLGCMVTLLHNANTAMLVVSEVGGGHALAHYSSAVLSTTRSGWQRDDHGEVIGIYATVQATKNKVGGSIDQVELDLHLDPYSRPSDDKNNGRLLLCK